MDGGINIKRAVIVDDEELSCELLKNLIEKYRLPIKIVGIACNGDNAITIINVKKPDIVFLDIEMPGINGIEVMKRVNVSCSGAIKFIIITAYGYFEYAQQALRHGAKDILLKPFDIGSLIETIERVIGYRYTDNRVFNDIIEYINDNYSKTISLDDCSKRFHVSPNYITRLFKKYTDLGFVAYISSVRINKAMELLSDTDLSIKEIAYMTGYNNINYFYKSFNRIAGTSPGGFRKRQDEKHEKK
jgi:two-component system, response regulator YesN